MYGNTNNFSRLFEIILKKKKKVINVILSNFMSYFKAELIKIGWNLHKDRHISQLNKIESRNKPAHKQFILDKSAKAVQRGKEIPF